MPFTVDNPGRLDAFLTEESGLSRAKVQSAIRSGSVMVNGEVVIKPSHALKANDAVEASFDTAEVEAGCITPADLDLKILYEDDACLVIDKPAGIAVHPGSGMDKEEQTILHGIAFLFEERSLPFSSDAVLVHRLDKETTGCLLIAKTSEAHAALQSQFEKRTVQKSYLALVAGVPDPAGAMIDAPVGRNLTDRTKMSVLKTGKSREAQTTYKTLDATNEAALLACDLHTGRTHQIRVHLSSVGHPILGDLSYSSPLSSDLTQNYGIQSLCLHAHTLQFDSPVAGTQTITAPLTPQFRAAAEACHLQHAVLHP